MYALITIGSSTPNLGTISLFVGGKVLKLKSYHFNHSANKLSVSLAIGSERLHDAIYSSIIEDISCSLACCLSMIEEIELF